MCACCIPHAEGTHPIRTHREHAAPLPGSHRKAVIGAATSWRDRGAALLQTEGLLSGSRAGMEALLAVFSGKWQGSVWVLYF